MGKGAMGKGDMEKGTMWKGDMEKGDMEKADMEKADMWELLKSRVLHLWQRHDRGCIYVYADIVRGITVNLKLHLKLTNHCSLPAPSSV